MLKFILGRACSGKSRYIVEDAARESLNKEVIIIVPEQFSFETERAVLHTESFNNDNISVLTFTKLYNEVSKIAGFGRLPVMSDGERILLTEMAFKSSQDKLKIFSKFINYPDFCLSLADTIRDFKLADVSADKLYSAATEIGGYSGAKIHDISVIMSAYDTLISKKFVDPSDYLTRLDNLLLDIDYFKGKTVYFDSFTGFTGQQHKIIKKILSTADDAVFSFCTDDIKNTDLNVFYNINECARRILSDASLSEAETVILDKNYYKNQTLKDLEAVFSGKELSGNENDGSLAIYSCDDPRQEVYAASTIIKHLVAEENYRYRDFIVVARNADDYKNYFEVFSKKNNIQCFYDKKVSLTDTALYIYINILLQLKLSFSTENILNFIKCGFNSFGENDIYALEDYVFVWNIQDSDWANEWTMHPRGLGKSEFKDEDKDVLDRVNALRKSVYELLGSFIKSFNGGAKSRVKALYSFLEKQKADKFLSAICKKYEDSGDRFNASALRQSWDAIMRVLDSIARLYDNEISSDTFAKSFKISCKAISLSNVPQMLDEVTFGSADRIRPSKPRVAIILGANLGVFPNNSSKTGLLNLSDKSKLEEKDIKLNDGEIKSAVEENYLVYSMLCCPVDKTIVFYSDKSASGETREKSAFISKICDNIKNTNIHKFNPLEEKFLPTTPEASLYLMSDLKGNDFETVKSSLIGDDKYADFVSSFDKKLSSSMRLSHENSYSIFKEDIRLSASSFEAYHNCMFKYLIRYGLGIEKLRRAELNKMQKGLVIHYVLEKLINKYHKNIANLTPDEINTEVDTLISDYLAQFPGTDILMTPRFQYILARIAKATKEVVTHICEEFKQSDFDPAYCELNISKKGIVPPLITDIDEGRMVLTGQVDRVDTYGNSIRIVDYKSGGKTFALSDTLSGLNLQMLIYLYAIIKNGSKIVSNPKPAGILYMQGASASKSDKLTMNGLIVDDKDIITAMEADNKGVYIPRKIKNSTTYVDEETFGLIFDNIDKQIKAMGKQIRSGELSPNPIKFSDFSTSCTFCDYASICRNKSLPFREIPKVKFSEFKDCLKGGEDSGI